MNSVVESQLRPLTHPQQRIWNVEKLFPGTPIHNLAGTATYRTDLDFSLLEEAFNTFLRTNDAARIRLTENGIDGPRQWVAEPSPIRIAVNDFSRESSPREALQEWLQQSATQPFALTDNSLFRVEFFRLAADECGYFLNLHHIISDGWSFQLLPTSISKTYERLSSGKGSGEEEAPSYFDLLDFEERYAGSEKFRKSRKFWRDYLSDAHGHPDRSIAPTTEGRQVRFSLDTTRSEALRLCAERAGCSIATVLTVLVLVYLWKRDGSDDVTLGMPITNRSGRRKRTFGMFTSTMPLRMHLSGTDTLSTLLGRLQHTLRQCLRHQQYPFDLIAQDLRSAHNGSGPLFETCVNYYNTRIHETAAIGGDRPRIDEIFVGQQLFPFYLVIKEWAHDGRIALDFNFKPAVFSESEVRGTHATLVRLLDRIAADPDCRLADLPFGSLPLRTSPAPADSQAQERSLRVATGKAEASDSADDAVSRFPATRPGSRTTPGAGEHLDFQLAAPLREKLATFSGDDETTARAALLGTTSLLLGRYLSTHAVEIAYDSGAESLPATLRAVRSTLEEDLPFEALVDRLRADLSEPPARSDRSGEPGSPSAYGMAVRFRHAATAEDLAHCPLHIEVAQHQGEMSGRIVFDESLYSRSMMQALSAQLLHTLDSALSAPTSRLGAIEILSEDERQQLLVTFNDTANDFPHDATVPRRFEQVAAQHPTANAVVGPGGSLSFGAMNARVNQFARFLLTRGLEPGTIVPVVAERSAGYLVAVLGILKARCAYLPIDASYPPARIAFILEDSGAALAVADSSSLPLIEGRIPQAFALDDETLFTGDASDLPSPPRPTDLAYVCYTSGSTGHPKGAMIEHRSLMNRIWWMQRAYPLDSGDVILQKTSIAFDVSGWELFWWAITGASVCVAPQGDERSPDALIDHIERFGVSTMHFVPSMLSAFISSVEASGQSSRLRSLRQVFASGEALRPHQVDAFNAALRGGGTRLINLYGPTEATIDVTYHDCPTSGRCEHVPIGRPIDNTRLRILDPQLRLQPIGAPGELYLGGVGVARGYHRRPGLTSRTFVADPFTDDGRLYRTGDLARWLPNGEVDFLGRRDSQVKVRGFRIELGEIDAAMLRHPAVEGAATVVRKVGGDTQQLCGFVVLNASCTLQELREHLLASLPEYMVPSQLTVLESFPLGPTGKLDHKALPTNARPTELSEDDLPKTEIERLLAAVWEETLDVAPIGIHDNFFALGGDSIKYLTLVTKAEAAGLELTFQQLYQNPTIRQLESVVARTDRSAKSPRQRERLALLSPEDAAKIPPSAEDAYPLSVLQAGLIFQSELNKATSLYHDVFSYRIQGQFDPVRFRAAAIELCRHHEIFRTTYRMTGFSEYIQIVHREIHDPLNLVDLRGLDAEIQEHLIERDLEDVRRQKFSWEEPGLIGFHIHWLDDSRYVYTIDFHDSALDGWSVNLIHSELFGTYYQLLAGQTVASGPTAISMRDFVRLERQALASETDREFWKRRLRGSSYEQIPRWPVSECAGPTEVRFHEIPLAGDLSDRVKDVASTLSVPVKSVLLAAHIRVLTLLNGTRDVVTGYEYSGRPEAIDGEKVLGLFLNSLPMRVETQATTWAGLIREVYETEVEFIPHRRYPMAQIKHDRGARYPLFETVFNFTHFHVLKELENLGGFNLSDVKVRAETEFVFRAEFSIQPFTDEVLFWIHYHSNVFPAEQIHQIGGYYARILEAMVRDPQGPIRSTSVLSDAERRRQLYDFSGQQWPLPKDRCFHHLFEDQVQATPKETAGSCGEEAWSFARLNATANRIAHKLIAIHPEQQRVVAMVMERDLWWMAAVIGCFKAGAVYLPLDPDHPPDRIAKALEQSQCVTVITSRATTASTREAVRSATLLGEIAVLPAEDLGHDGDDSNPSVQVATEDLAYVIFTSGSTGVPKGAMVEHRGMINHLFSKVNDLDLEPTDVVAQNASQCFDISVWQLIAGLLVGARTVIYPKDTVIDIERFIERTNEDGVTILEVVPSYLESLLRSHEYRPLILDQVRLLLVTGEPVKVGLTEAWFAAFPQIPLVNAYGPTEASDDITHHVMTVAPTGASVPVGTPIQNLNVYVVDDGMQLVPIGSRGEVVVAGVGVGRGYINDPERTEAAFGTDPFQRGEVPLYKTGDIGRWLPDGVLELLGRGDDQIKLRGYRIEIGEIESHLGRWPEVRDAVVLVSDKSSAPELVALLACPGDLDLPALKDALHAKLPDYMIPSRFVTVDALPLNENGKVARSRLPDLVPETVEDHDKLRPLEGPTENWLAELWGQVLRVEASSIGGNTDFFDIGGDSLKAMEMSFKADGQLSINDIFTYPALKDLARHIETTPAGESADRILIDYTSATTSPRVAIVGFTYAAGNAVNFKPLFDAIQGRCSTIGCYAIEMPGHTWPNSHGDLRDLASTAAACVETIHEQIQVPVVLWGHCSGTALMLEVARRLEASGDDLGHIFVGGKVMRSRLAALGRATAAALLSPFMPVDAKMMSPQQIKDWMVDKTGFEGFEQLDDEQTLFVTELFKHDATCANLYLYEAHREWKDTQLRAAITNVVADDDALTKSYRKTYKNWSLFTDNVDLRVLPNAGHYFIKTQPNETADILLRKMKDLDLID